MTLEELLQRGVQCVSGQLIYQNAHVGVPGKEGPVLNEKGKELLGDAPTVEEPLPVIKRGRRKAEPTNDLIGNTEPE
jgi:hypothetical protein